MSSKERIGREIINEIKAAYMGGREFGTVHDVRQFVIDSLGAKPKNTTVTQVGGWDRQARLELAKNNKVSVTSPSAVNGYVRNPNAKHGERDRSRKIRLKDTRTRVRNDLIEAESDAAQSDGNEVERIRSKVFATVHRLLEDITEGGA